MDENIKDHDVLLVNENGGTDLKVVSGIDKDGKPKTVSPTKENEPDFMKIDKQSNALENFMSNYLRQAKDPTHFNFFRVPAENVDAESYVLGDMLKDPDNPSNKEALDSVRVNPEDYAKQAAEQGYKPMDESRIDWSKFEEIGVKRENLAKDNSLDEMLNYRKTPNLVNVTIQLDETTVRTQARLSLRETEDGRIIPFVHGIQKQPELDRPFYGANFSKEDKTNLLETGNLGRVVELKIPNAPQNVASFVSVDKLTNELVAFRADKVKIPDEIKGVKLDEMQKMFLKDGKAIYLEGMTSKNGKEFNATVQVNADKRGLEFQFRDGQKQAQSQGQNNVDPQTGEFKIPQKLGGVELSPEQQSKLKAGETIYVQGLTNKAGETYDTYIRINEKEQKLDFFKWNPDKTAKQSNETPKQEQAEQQKQEAEKKPDLKKGKGLGM